MPATSSDEVVKWEKWKLKITLTDMSGTARTNEEFWYGIYQIGEVGG